MGEESISSLHTAGEILSLYAQGDRPFCQKLEKQLHLLRHQGFISTWHQYCIFPENIQNQGEDFRFETALVILLLVSDELLASDFCYGNEMQRLMERHAAHRARLIPILLRPVDWEGAPFAHLQMLPTGAKPITMWRNRDAAWTDITGGIRRVLSDLILQGRKASNLSFGKKSGRILEQTEIEGELQSPSSLLFSQIESNTLTPSSFPLSDFFLPLPMDMPLLGRSALLSRLKKLLLGRLPLPCLAFHGLPGAGKTALALELAYDVELRQAYSDGILWAGLGQKSNVLGHMSRWGALLGIASDELAKKNCPVAWAEALRARIGTRHVLLVIDDAWTLPDALALKVGGPNCALLITTRFPHIALQLAGNQAFAVSELTEQEGVTLLLRLVPGLETLEPSHIQKLAGLGGGLPLALTLMGKYLRVQAYSRQPRRIHAAVTSLFDAEARLRLSEPYALTERHTSLSQGVSLSLQSVIAVSDQVLDEQVARALRALSVFPAKPHSFSEEAAISIINLPIEVLDALTDTGLLESSSVGRYTLHQTIADYARLNLGDPGPSERMIKYFVQYVQEHEKDYNALEMERVPIFTALDLAHEIGRREDLIRGTIAITSFLQARSLYIPAEVYLQRAYEAALELQRFSDVATILLHLGKTARSLGDMEQGKAYLQEGLALARKIENKECLSALLNALGELVRIQGHMQLSEEYHREALSLAREIEHDEQMCMALASLGRLARNRADYTEAEPYLREALGIARQLHNHEVTIFILWSLAVVLFEQASFASGETYLLEALKLARLLGHHARISTLLINLGTTLGEQKNYSDAYTYLLEGLSIARKFGLADSICLALLNLAALSREQEHDLQATLHLQEGLALARHQNYFWYISVILCEWGELDLKEKRFQEAMDKFEEAFATAPEESLELRMINQYGIARAEALQGKIVRARALGEVCVTFLESKGHRYAKAARRWFDTLPAAP